MQTRFTVITLFALALVACGATPPPAASAPTSPAASGPAPRVDAAANPNERRVTLAPGEVFAITHLVLRDGTVETDFRVDGGHEVHFMRVAHPRSDLVQDRNRIHAKCPGLSEHPVRVMVDLSSSHLIVGLKGSEPGLFTTMWKNEQSVPEVLVVTLVPNGSVIVFSAWHALATESSKLKAPGSYPL
jgi:hypothetical protein